MPLIYAHVVFVGGYGWLIGAGAAVGAKQGKVRDRRMAGWVTIVAMAIGYYAACAFWLALVFDSSVVDFIKPATLWRAMVQAGETGTWSLTREGLLAEQRVNGIMLWLIWAAEAIGIFGMAWMIAGRRAPNYAFCDDCNTWCDKGRRLHSYGGVSGVEVKLKLAQWDWKFLATLARPQHRQMRRVDLEHYICKCGRTHALAVRQVMITAKATGRVEKKVMVMEKLLVSAEEVATIEAAPPLEPMEAVREMPLHGDDHVDLGL
jgi:hypothetical protein